MGELLLRPIAVHDEERGQPERLRLEHDAPIATPADRDLRDVVASHLAKVLAVVGNGQDVQALATVREERDALAVRGPLGCEIASGVVWCTPVARRSRAVV